MTVAQMKVPDFVFVSFRSARAVASKYGAFKMSRTSIQLLNVFLDEVLYVLVKSSPDNKLSYTTLPATLRRLCSQGSLAVNAISNGESFLSQSSLKSDPREFPQGQLPLSTIVDTARAQCSIYNTMGTSCGFVPKGHALITSKTAAFLCGIMEHIATFLIVEAVLLARNSQVECVDSKLFEEAVKTNKEIRGIYTRSSLVDGLEIRRAERFGPKFERSSSSSVDSDSLSDFDCEEDISPRSSDESARGRDRGAFAKIFGGFKGSRVKGVPISNSFVSPRSSIEDFLFSGRQSTKISKSLESATSPLSLQIPECNRARSVSPSPVDPEKAKNFEALINSTETLKISLTSTRLNTIEVKNPNKPKLVPRDEGSVNSLNLVQIMQELGEPPVKV
ncbi:hypothetical protein K493DRAFT_317758 [Basidiobolus meristosporus CBS 931.73]|uniref:Uncharacterized protein n=1 Tax=Basidiobolus meristosporus CBS 931.73 TaxID=1314790 RepID=A0A1Y1XYB5_9FUNG|nr:hypothetical protein K493DRAFT_317758 [Basidiobolus meristosporus CBS 931.73]|eukprot:ORX90740.1 hypothetical protein K493DRAFT_317758 [Basidiobolus meristosporus CBS 931.73]